MAIYFYDGVMPLYMINEFNWFNIYLKSLVKAAAFILNTLTHEILFDSDTTWENRSQTKQIGVTYRQETIRNERSRSKIQTWMGIRWVGNTTKRTQNDDKLLHLCQYNVITLYYRWNDIASTLIRRYLKYILSFRQS